jgi:hypothetical protein
MPADPDPLPGFPAEDTGTYGIDDTRDFMSGDPGIADPRKDPFFGHGIGVTDATSLDLDPHRPG